MRRLSLIQESADPNESTPIHEQFTPLSERALRSDGTIGVKIIKPGWGTSGYYSKAMLERDIPKVFPVGTQMFWNHDTAMEEAERPEGDLSRLAAVTVSAPIWLDNGAKGPGMYADVRPFAGYAEAIDEIGEHIGVSIRALGRHRLGEAEGKRGKLIDELVIGKSVDFVTVPGAGGAILSVFEAAPHAPKLPDPGIQQFLSEAGRVLSATNEKKLRTALEQLTAVLSILDDTSEAAAKLKEARNIGEWLESRLHLHLANIGDDLYGDGRVSREERMALSSAIGKALDAYRGNLLKNAPQLFERDLYQDAPVSSDLPAGIDESTRPDAATNPTEDDMELNEALDALTEARTELEARNAALAKMQEQLLLREARDFVSGKLAAADLPEMTKTRLARELASNPPVADGRIDEAAFEKQVETAVTEARAEIAAISGSDGRVTGNGDSTPAADNQEGINEARARQEKALAAMGYGGLNGN